MVTSIQDSAVLDALSCAKIVFRLHPRFPLLPRKSQAGAPNTRARLCIPLSMGEDYETKHLEALRMEHFDCGSRRGAFRVVDERRHADLSAGRDPAAAVAAAHRIPNRLGHSVCPDGDWCSADLHVPAVPAARPSAQSVRGAAHCQFLLESYLLQRAGVRRRIPLASSAVGAGFVDDSHIPACRSPRRPASAPLFALADLCRIPEPRRMVSESPVAENAAHLRLSQDFGFAAAAGFSVPAAPPLSGLIPGANESSTSASFIARRAMRTYGTRMFACFPDPSQGAAAFGDRPSAFRRRLVSGKQAHPCPKAPMPKSSGVNLGGFRNGHVHVRGSPRPLIRAARRIPTAAPHHPTKKRVGIRGAAFTLSELASQGIFLIKWSAAMLSCYRHGAPRIAARNRIDFVFGGNAETTLPATG